MKLISAALVFNQSSTGCTSGVQVVDIDYYRHRHGLATSYLSRWRSCSVVIFCGHLLSFAACALLRSALRATSRSERKAIAPFCGQGVFARQAPSSGKPALPSAQAFDIELKFAKDQYKTNLKKGGSMSKLPGLQKHRNDLRSQREGSGASLLSSLAWPHRSSWECCRGAPRSSRGTADGIGTDRAQRPGECTETCAEIRSAEPSPRSRPFVPRIPRISRVSQFSLFVVSIGRSHPKTCKGPLLIDEANHRSETTLLVDEGIYSREALLRTCLVYRPLLCLHHSPRLRALRRQPDAEARRPGVRNCCRGVRQRPSGLAGQTGHPAGDSRPSRADRGQSVRRRKFAGGCAGR